MKLSKYILPAFVVAALFAASCTDEPTGESTKVPTGSTQKPDPTPEEPTVNPSDVVSPIPDFTCTTTKTTIDVSKKYQVMEGFGASDCWLPAQIGQYWKSNRAQIARYLFSKSVSKGQPAGIGLSMWRVNLGAGTAEQGNDSGIDANNRAQSYLTDGVYNWDKCEGQRYFMQQAKNNGCESFVLFSNSPLVQFTKNGKGFSESGDHVNLKDDCFDDFAEYMVAVAEHFNADGYNVTHISPVNEPQNNWNPDDQGHSSQEGSGWSNYDVAKIAKELDKALAAKNSSTKILIPEAGAYDCLYEGNANARTDQINAFWSASSSSYIGNLAYLDKVVAGHSYWTDKTWAPMRDCRKRLGNAAAGKGLRVWQTEWSMLGDCPGDLPGYDQCSEFDLALYMSKVIHNDIAMAGCSSWSYWTAMSVERWSQKNRFELIKTTPAGGQYSDDFTAEGTIEVTPNLWVLGNYSLFVRPGYTRVDLNGADNANFCGTAYVSADGKTIVAVYTNADKAKGVMLDNTFAGAGTLKKVTRYSTTEKKNLLGEDFNPADKVFVEPNSVSTIVYTFE